MNNSFSAGDDLMCVEIKSLRPKSFLTSRTIRINMEEINRERAQLKSTDNSRRSSLTQGRNSIVKIPIRKNELDTLEIAEAESSADKCCVLLPTAQRRRMNNT